MKALPLLVATPAETRKLRSFVLGIMLASTPGWAAGPPQEMKALRAEFTASLATATIPVLRQQVKDLLALEKKAAAARDYDTAIAARDERKRIEAAIADLDKASLFASSASTTAGDAEPERVVLKLADAKLDRVRFDPNAGVLTDWSGTGASATWQLPNLAPGGYEVVLKYQSGPLEGGSVLVQESFYTLSADLQTTLKEATEHNLGTLRLRKGDGQLKLSARTILKSNLMQLHSVELIPANR